LKQIGPAQGPLRGGAHGGNQFLIRVETDTPVSPRMPDTFVNYFGPQRFGDGFVEVGQYLLESRFDEAADLLQDSTMNGAQLKQLLKEGLSPEMALLHPSMHKIISRKLLQWQSHLWNLLAESVFATSIDSAVRLPTWDLATAHLYDYFWDPAEIDIGLTEYLHSFTRKLFVQAKNRAFQSVPGGFQYKFQLPPGAFATVYLNTMFELQNSTKRSFG
jgi:tRNA(Glu) U13 pseudouridine synthase TruD